MNADPTDTRLLSDAPRGEPDGAAAEAVRAPQVDGGARGHRAAAARRARALLPLPEARARAAHDEPEAAPAPRRDQHYLRDRTSGRRRAAARALSALLLKTLLRNFT